MAARSPPRPAPGSLLDLGILLRWREAERRDGMLQLLDGGQPGAARLGGLASGQRNLPLQQDVTPPANSSRVAATDSEHPDHAAALAEFRDTYGDDARLAELDVTPFDLDEIKDTLGLLGLGDDRHHAEPVGPKTCATCADVLWAPSARSRVRYVAGRS
jgi:hypothetical protein